MLHIAYMIPRLLYKIEYTVVYVIVPRIGHTEDAEICFRDLLLYAIIYSH
jgi:hypothetical protein